MNFQSSEIACILLGFYMILVNLVTFFAFGYDKLVSSFAQNKNYRRISEKFLIRLIKVGGLCGAKCAMIIFNHKTSKQSFQINSDSLAIRLCNFSLISLYYIARYAD
ncbi:hypothetical protein ABPG72_011413 [Tetrahymena utriculariae]